jgi:nucleotide-binding universal stress UspA family protein
MMVSSSASSNVHEGVAKTSAQSSSAASSPVLACIDTAAMTEGLIPQAVAMADALRAPLTLLHVLELPSPSDAPTDPLDWNIRRQEEHGRVRQAVGDVYPNLLEIDVRIAEGRPVDQICRRMRELQAAVTVIGTKVNKNAAHWELGETARKLIDRSRGTLLLVPPSVNADPDVHYRRLLVPLDGSRMAESILPLATRIASAVGAELLLAHIIPTPELTETGPLEANDHTLRQQMSERNTRVAREYIDRIRNQLTGSGLAVRGLLVADEDVRSALARLIEDERIDLLIMSAHGHSSRPDVACGSIAGYMITHARTPVLIVMGEHVHRDRHADDDQRSKRPPRGPLS